MVEQAALVIETPSISGERAIRADRAMAWDDNRERIGAVRRTDCARGVGPSESLRDLAIRSRRPPRNRAEFLPNGKLEGRRSNINRASDFLSMPFNKIDHEAGELPQPVIIASDFRSGQIAPKLRFQMRIQIRDSDPTYPD